MDNATTFVTGRLTQAPRVFGEDKKMRALFTIAVNRGIGDKRKASFIDCIAWGKRAEIVASFDKGTTIFVQGQLEQDTFEKKLDDGTTRKVNKLQVNVDTILRGAPNPNAGGGNTSSDEEEEVEVGVGDGDPF